MMWLVLLILLVILLLLVYLIIVTRTPSVSVEDRLEDERNMVNTSLQKANQFVQDICVHIDQSEPYVVLPGELNTIENNHIYINIYIYNQTQIYSQIIQLIANDLNRKHGIKDIHTTVKRIEQAAYTLGYLTSTLDCNKDGNC